MSRENKEFIDELESFIDKLDRVSSLKEKHKEALENLEELEESLNHEIINNISRSGYIVNHHMGTFYARKGRKRYEGLDPFELVQNILEDI